jgi:hypothetical protein
MPIKIIITKTLEDWWGADEALADGGETALLELLHEDILALIENASWTIEIEKQSKDPEQLRDFHKDDKGDWYPF